MTDEQLAALFPHRARAKRRACCSWHNFTGDFVHHWRRKSISGQPSRREVATAILDWQAGNTGYEAVCNLLARRKEEKEKTMTDDKLAAIYAAADRVYAAEEWSLAKSQAAGNLHALVAHTDTLLSLIARLRAAEQREFVRLTNEEIATAIGDSEVHTPSQWVSMGRRIEDEVIRKNWGA